MRYTQPSYTWNPEELDTLEDELRERGGDVEFLESLRRQAESRLVSEQIARFLALFLRKGNLRARALGLAFAAGLNRLHGYVSLADAARDLGVTKASLSKLQIFWRSVLNLPVNEHGVSAERMHADALDKLRNHWRRKHSKGRALSQLRVHGLPEGEVRLQVVNGETIRAFVGGVEYRPEIDEKGVAFKKVTV